ncbi:YceG-like protein [Campylobacter blaseri]|uniref:Endolytic murein transglycosylase n=1 Tax=Campylobacter blaseri TaxID=2042961 RepID=A0A2P8R2L1_9BACT|nr:endolytic transglycosylase MltG [Campylobacter blaseri]PSM52727.1 aminodeoxychorismate lyase [Campylobacter blaseri]PSM54375.1 aminodeoxychorismate lyase [Campylobacter blaseri]QKF86031.1 YceG-like protein [Campylobacter blaseri]
MVNIIRIFCIILDIIFIFILAIADNVTMPVNFKNTIYIPKGSSTKIIAELSKQNFNGTIFDAKLLSLVGMPQHGYIDIGDNSLNKIDFLYKLTIAKPQMIEITLIPGKTTIITFEDISKKYNFDIGKLEDEYIKQTPFYEGFLIPETYLVAKGFNEKELIEILIKESKKSHKKLSKEYFGDYNETKWIEVLTKASIIQKEAANIKEMSIVSSVIDNRLSLGMPLQMDGSLNYGKYSNIKITSDRIKNDTSRYNTYIHKGLPPAPVCLISIDAIKAALNPDKTKYLYFMRDKKTGEHVFTKTYKEHINQINIQRKIK